MESFVKFTWKHMWWIPFSLNLYVDLRKKLHCRCSPVSFKQFFIIAEHLWKETCELLDNFVVEFNSLFPHSHHNLRTHTCRNETCIKGIFENIRWIPQMKNLSHEMVALPCEGIIWWCQENNSNNKKTRFQKRFQLGNFFKSRSRGKCVSEFFGSILDLLELFPILKSAKCFQESVSFTFKFYLLLRRANRGAL